MPTLKFQPEADRYYADGYWRDGDLWSDFARRADGAGGCRVHGDGPAVGR